MRIVRLLFIILFSATLLAQNNTQKYSANLKNQISGLSNDETVLVWVFFKDKGLSLSKYYQNAQTVVSEKSLQRRSKVLPKSDLIDFSDLPVNQNYINQLETLNIHVKQKSKWLNGISAFIPKSLLPAVASNDFVRKIDLVVTFKRGTRPDTQEQPAVENRLRKSGAYNLDYGSSLGQLEQINVPALHDMGYTGKGVTIAVMDDGVSNLQHEVFARMINNNQIIAEYDFVNHDGDISNQADSGNGDHGTHTLGLIGGYKPGQYIGAAYDADFILAKTENTQSESSVEEDNWLAAMEWADSIGVDVISSSLGYRYDFTWGTGYTSAQMDGNTAIITRAADLAAKKGIVVVTSAGNEAQTHAGDQNTLNAPADGDSVITVGAVYITGRRAEFSSYGPTADGRTKPDVMADGVSDYLPSGQPGNVSGYVLGDGTSYACPMVAGVVADLLQAHPTWTPIQVREALRFTASLNNNPSDTSGWGIVNAVAAVNSNPAVPKEPVLYSPSTGAVDQPTIADLEWGRVPWSESYSVKVSKDSLFANMVFNKSSIKDTTVQVSGLDKDTKYYWKVTASNGLGESNPSPVYSFTTSSGDNNQQLPSTFVLEQNYPNPFNPSTVITYKIPESGFVSLKVYNLLGNQVATLVNETKPQGTYSVEFDVKKRENPLPSGVYFYRLQVGNFVSTKKMVVMK